LIEVVSARIASGVAPEYAEELAHLLRENTSQQEMRSLWLDRVSRERRDDSSPWYAVATPLGAIRALKEADLQVVLDEPPPASVLLSFAQSGRADVVLNSEELSLALARYALRWPGVSAGSEPAADLFSAFSTVIGPGAYSATGRPSGIPLIQTLRPRRKEAKSLPTDTGGRAHLERMATVVQAFNDAAALTLDDWSARLGPFETVIEAIRRGYGETRAGYLLAVIAAAVPHAPERAWRVANLYDDEVSLAKRTRVARYRAGQPQWWARMLSERSEPDYQWFVLLAAWTWASPAVLTALVSEFQREVERLTSSELLALDRALRMTVMRTRRTDELPQEFFRSVSGPRLAALALARLKGAGRDQVWQEWLKGYRGAEAAVLHARAREAVRRIKSPSGWGEAVAAAKRAYASGFAVPLPSRLHRDETAPRMPGAVAERVLRDLSAYPRSVIAVAERTTRDSIAASASPVMDLAHEAGWFAEH
jgi:hypothetical protein